MSGTRFWAASFTTFCTSSTDCGRTTYPGAATASPRQSRRSSGVIPASAEWSGGWRSRVPFQLRLGEKSGGVRGYVRSDVVGGQRALVRLLQPASDVRLGPRETVSVAHQALDDYGVTSLTTNVQITASGVDATGEPMTSTCGPFSSNGRSNVETTVEAENVPSTRSASRPCCALLSYCFLPLSFGSACRPPFGRMRQRITEQA